MPINDSLDVRAGGGRGGRGATSYEYDGDGDDDGDEEDEAEGGAPHEEDGTPCVYPYFSAV